MKRVHFPFDGVSGNLPLLVGENFGDEAADHIEMRKTDSTIARQWVAELEGGLSSVHLRAFARHQEVAPAMVYQWCGLPIPTWRERLKTLLKSATAVLLPKAGGHA